MRIFLTDIFIASMMTEAHLLKHLAPTDNDPVQNRNEDQAVPTLSAIPVGFGADGVGEPGRDRRAGRLSVRSGQPDVLGLARGHRPAVP